MACKAQSSFDVRNLRALIAACQQNHNFTADSFEIYSVARAVIDPQFRNSLTHRLDVSGVARGKALNPDLDPCTRTDIVQPVKPPGKHFGLANFHDVLL